MTIEILFQTYLNQLRMQQWLLGIKKVGDTVKRDEVIVEIETDKARSARTF